MPHSDFFKNYSWAKYNNWETELKPCYDNAAHMLGRVKFDEQNIEDNLLHQVAKDIGKGDSFDNVHVAVYFNNDKTPADPYFNGEGPLRTPCTKCAGCMVGCRENAKNTLDKNYLWFAEKYGAQILSETNVWKIEYINEEYLIHTTNSIGLFPGNRRVFKSKGIIISGGVLGTLKLLLNQKYNFKTLSKLSDTLGENVRTNSETLCTATLSNLKLNNGIAITSIFKPDKNTSIEIVKYPDGSNLMRNLLTLATDKKGSTGLRIFHFFGKMIIHPFLFFRMLLNRKWAENTIIFLVMQSTESKMKLVLKRWPFKKRITMINDENHKVEAYLPVGQDVMRRYAKIANAIPQNSTAEILMNIPSTAHILGGIPMSDSIAAGVIDKNFEVFGYPRMYILDGSVIQGNPGVNPSFTIAALAEYAMQKIPPKSQAN
jgi:cholesterol oxidase